MLVGRSGCGKSTLSAIIQGYDVWADFNEHSKMLDL